MLTHWADGHRGVSPDWRYAAGVIGIPGRAHPSPSCIHPPGQGPSASVGTSPEPVPAGARSGGKSSQRSNMTATDLIYIFAPNASFLANLTANGGRFVIVGGVAVRYYIPSREADDLDVLIDPTEQNAVAVINALNSCGNPRWDCPPSRLTRPHLHFRVKKYYYLDILTPDADTNFDAVWSEGTEARVAHTPHSIAVRVASIPRLIEMIASSNKPKHLDDIRMLQASRT
jgi:hypothetical protein